MAYFSLAATAGGLRKAGEGKRMASGLIGIQVPRKGLWVRVPCPPLFLCGHYASLTDSAASESNLYHTRCAALVE